MLWAVQEKAAGVRVLKEVEELAASKVEASQQSASSASCQAAKQFLHEAPYEQVLPCLLYLAHAYALHGIRLTRVALALGVHARHQARHLIVLLLLSLLFCRNNDDGAVMVMVMVITITIIGTTVITITR